MKSNEIGEIEVIWNDGVSVIFQETIYSPETWAIGVESGMARERVLDEVSRVAAKAKAHRETKYDGFGPLPPGYFAICQESQPIYRAAFDQAWKEGGSK